MATDAGVTNITSTRVQYIFGDAVRSSFCLCDADLIFKETRSLVAVKPRRPPMTDVGTETAFRLDQRKHFRKSNHLLRSEVN